MRHRKWKLLLDWVLLVTGLTTFSTGLVLLFCFHVGLGPFAMSALGVGRLAWLNVHRLFAVPMILCVITHVGLHFKTFLARLKNVARRGARRRINSELVMYAAFFVALSTGLVAWWVLAGSSPLFGPAVIGRASSTRHPWIDTHHISSLVSLLLIVHHIGHRWRFLLRRARPGAKRSGTLGSRQRRFKPMPRLPTRQHAPSDAAARRYGVPRLPRATPTRRSPVLAVCRSLTKHGSSAAAPKAQTCNGSLT